MMGSLASKRLLALALSCAGTWTAAQAQDDPSVRRNNNTAMDVPLARLGARGVVAPADLAFMQKAKQSGQMEVRAGSLAIAQGGNVRIKAFGRRLIEDHSDANRQLEKLALARGVRLPGNPSAEQETKLRALAGLRGPEFDRQFLAHMGTSAHDEALSLFMEQASHGSDAQLREFAAATLPKLQSHRDHARGIEVDLLQPTTAGRPSASSGG